MLDFFYPKKKQPLLRNVLFAFSNIAVARLCNWNAASETSDKKNEEEEEKKRREMTEKKTRATEKKVSQ